MPSYLLRRARLVLLSLILILPCTALAAPKGKKAVVSALLRFVPAISIDYPSNGASVYSDQLASASPWYDPATQKLRVTGSVRRSEINYLRQGILYVRVNGQRVNRLRIRRKHRNISKFSIGSATFVTSIPLARNERWPMQSVMVELVHVGTNRVLARDRIMLYDLRAESGATTEFPTNAPIIGMLSQLTDSGLGAVGTPDTFAGMEQALLPMLPHPSLSEFNNRLSERASHIRHYDNDEDKLGTCIDLNDVNEPNFRNPVLFTAYGEALGEAQVAYTTYENRDSVCPALVQPALIAACYLAMEQSCVKESPDASDFELCVDQIEGDVESATIQSVDDIDLAFRESLGGDRALLNSHTTLLGLHADVTGYVRSFKVRWKDAVCVGRPSATFNDDAIQDIPWLNNWATCPHLSSDFERASTVLFSHPSEIEVLPVEDDQEVFVAKQTQPGSFTLTDRTTDNSDGSCSLEFLAPYTTSMIESFTSDIRDSLNDAWYANAPVTQEAYLLSNLFTTYFLGKVPVPQHEIDAHLISIESDEVRGMS
ncbi:MAG: hypothetical protein KDD60_09225, partial [Bdellovibrionales bacterium]|nr:hypothetical protein [Bdellovibrionales bacterium]